ncbi:MAG: hypothetical protein B7Z73_04875 [Planctomycetia bacterium 21-64-5]|nr:MAG: hypothetical protein B7Z73_04875 [Planctomycetia bacterium 21-64-5]
MRYFRWLGQKLAESNPEVTNGPSASDAPVVALPGHRGGGALSRERAERAALPQPPLFVSTTAACRIAREAVGWLSGGALALACYLPIFGQVRNAARSASPSSWSYLPVIAGNFFRPATHDLIWFAPLFLAGLATWMLPRRDGQPRHWVVPALTVAVAVGAFLTTGLLRISPFERNYCPLLVFLALAEGWLLTELIEAVHARWLNRWPREAATALGLAAVSLPLWPMLWTYPQRLEVRRAKVGPSAEAPLADGYYCYYAANYRPSAVVQHLLAAGVERSAYRVCFTKADHHNLVYYFARSGLPPFAGFEQGEPAAGRVALFAVAPKPPPWQRLAHDCGLAPEQIDTFEPVGDFGYYWLWEQH